MQIIENNLRTAISKANATSPEDRNQIYLAAREIILKLPPEKSETAMQSLFAAVKVIEAEYVAKEFTNSPDRISPPSPDTNHKLIPLIKKIISFRSSKFSWPIIASIVVGLSVMVFSTYLLISQFTGENASFDQNFTTGEIPSPLVSKFLINSLSDLNKLSSDVTGSSIPNSALSEDTTEELKFKNFVSLYGSSEISIKPDQLLHMQLKLRYSPHTSPVALQAGFARFNQSDQTALHADKLHSGPVQLNSYREDLKLFSFSSIVSWDDLKSELKFEGKEASVKPFVIASSQDKNIEIQILSISVNRID